MAHGVIASFLGLLLLCGCGCRKSGGQAREPAQSNTTPEWQSTLRIITDANDIRSAEQAAVRRKGLSYGQSLIRDINDFVYVGESDVPRLEQEKTSLTPQLRQVLDSPASSTKAKENSACLLFLLGDESGIDYFLDRMESASPSEQAKALWTLPKESPAVIISHPRLSGALLNLLDSSDPKVQAEAIQVCGYVALPGSMEGFARLLAQPGAFKKGRLCFWLSKHAPTRDNLMLISDCLLSAQRKEESTWMCYALEDYLKLGDSALREEALATVREYFARPRNPADSDRDYVEMLGVLAQDCQPKDASFLLAQINDGRYKPYVTDDTVAGLARLPADDAVPQLCGLLADERLAGFAVPVIASLRKNTSDSAIVEQLDSLFKRTKWSRIRERIVRALLDIGGEEAIRRAEILTSQLPEESRWEFLWRIRGIDMDAFVNFMNSTGLCSQIDPAQVREHLRESWFDRPAPADWLLDATLSASGIYLSFDTETDELPCRHDELISDFSKASMRVFHTQWTNEIWHQKNDKDYEADYSVQFLFNGRLYEFTAQNFGDWYDLTSVVDAIHRALSDAGIRQRFFSLKSDGQDARFIFCTPEFADELRQKYYFAFDADLDRTMKQGKDFENEVKKRLETLE